MYHRVQRMRDGSAGGLLDPTQPCILSGRASATQNEALDLGYSIELNSYI